jgi:hypothetical protein
MNRDTKQMDPTLKYAVGNLKGKPLDSCSYDYRIINYRGEEVAQFTNGAMAKFYRDKPSPGAMLSALEAEESPANDVVVSIDVERLDFERQVQNAIEGDVEACREIRETVLYCITENGLNITNYSREEVGTGWSEYRWIYRKYRELGRNRFIAAWLAAELMFA